MSKKVIVKRYRGNGRLFELLKEMEGISLCGFTDKDTSVWGIEENGYPIYSIFHVAELYKKQKIDKIIFAYDIEEKLLSKMVKEISNLGIERQDIWIAKPEFYKEPLLENICTYDAYHRLPYLEFHVADHCNLNCKGCVHFSPLVPREKFADYETVRQDLLQLKK